MTAIRPAIQLDQPITGRVNNLQQCKESFLNRASVTMYCHSFVFNPDGTDFMYPCQMCTEDQQISFFGEGDRISISVKAPTKGVYNTKLLTVVSRSAPDQRQDAHSKFPIEDQIQVAMTVTSLALRYATTFYAIKGDATVDDVTRLAKEMREWMLAHIGSDNIMVEGTAVLKSMELAVDFYKERAVESDVCLDFAGSIFSQFNMME